ncbi:hypothetical protein [Prevotella sp. E2-28]|uniref:hypothetical protein n=1 Tax=Prevotella sp. E2-28 TaxID=2913620 RepID=UPI001EDB91CB|nr:hypothetical protein [Prevotella sp. E2-28]UKK52632.1 hypothetical protein L6465_08440 [Prevotella sp. E2-28]
MTSNLFTTAQHSNHVRQIECYPECGRENDEFEELEEDDDEVCNDGYRLDPAFGSWEEVNGMFL